MPCCVAGCPGSVRLVQFPSDSVLRRRWRDAITLATGTGPPTEEQSLELCEDHFEGDASSAERYREPTRFSDRSGQPVELGSCRLCHRFEVASRLYSLDGSMADVAVGTILRDLIKVKLEQSDVQQFACGVCLTQVGMVLNIQKSFIVKGDPDVENLDSIDPLAEVTCCRLCHRYEPTNTMCFLDDDLTDGVSIGSTLSAILQSGDDLAQLICLNCLAKIDLMRSVQSFFVGKDEEFRGWQREGLVTVDLDCHPELMLEVKVEPVEIQETVRETRSRKAKGKVVKLVKDKKESADVQKTVKETRQKKAKGLKLVKEKKESDVKEEAQAVKEELKLNKEKAQFECKICDKKFQKKISLKFHLLIHTGELPHKCSQCDASFRLSTELSKHVMGVHEGKTPYDCKECNVPLATKTEYYRHRRMAHTTKIYKYDSFLYRCLVCEATGKNVGELRKHIQAFHDENYPYLKCPECPQLQLTSTTHVRVHGYDKHPGSGTGERFVCDKCGKDFARKTALKKHVLAVHSEPGTTKRFPCPYCEKTFRLYSSYHRHKDTHAGIKRYACTICEQKFSHSPSLKNHIRNVHTLEKPYRCEVCGDCFRNGSLLNKHRGAFHSPSDAILEKVSCPICLEVFPTRSLLQQHVRSVHEERQEFGCLECGEVFNSFAELKDHRAYQHPEVGLPFPCETCGEQYEQKAQLTKHCRNAHPEQNRLVCAECGKLFSSASTLRQHREIHRDVRKFRCTYCEQTFAQRTPLKNHIRNKHTGEKPFSCETCGKPFSDSSVYYRHRIKCFRELAAKNKSEDPSLVKQEC
ncbi:zinc finger protein 93-like [Culex pipiens pallens]|nr:zinc finger protein 93-like [Culex pipiens pallens]